MSAAHQIALYAPAPLRWILGVLCAYRADAYGGIYSGRVSGWSVFAQHFAHSRNWYLAVAFPDGGLGDDFHEDFDVFDLKGNDLDALIIDAHGCLASALLRDVVRTLIGGLR